MCISEEMRYRSELEAEAVNQVTEISIGVVDVVKQLGMYGKSGYLWSPRQWNPDSGGGENSLDYLEVFHVFIRRANSSRKALHQTR